jgi:NADH dehydrogenase
MISASDDASRPSPPRIVIVGGGFGGAYCAQALERRLRGRDAAVLLLDRNNYLLFYPLLIEAGTGSIEPRHAVVSIRSFLRRTDFRMARVLGVDRARHVVHYQLVGGEEVRAAPYDHLVLAPGSVTMLPPVPGLREHGYEMKDLADAVALRDHCIRLLERAEAAAGADERRALLRLVVVGGNFSGAEVTGEFHEFIRRAARDYRNVHPRDCNMMLVERDARILKALDEDLSQYAVTVMRRRGIDVRLNETVREIHPDHLILGCGERVDTRTVIWCAGIAPSPLLAGLGLPLDPRGYLRCQADLRVEGETNIWAIGDSAVNLGLDGRPYPATAQHALRQGVTLADNLARTLRGEPTHPCAIRSQGSLAALGCRTGVARVFGVKLSGLPAWFLWRTVYLMKMPGWGRRVRVALDWTLGLIFRRDHVQTGVHQRPPR